MLKPAVKLARKLLEDDEDRLEDLRMHEFEDDQSAHDRKVVEQLYAEFAAEFDRVQAELEESYGPPSRSGEGSDTLIPLNGVLRYAFWQVGEKQLYLAVAHEDTLFSIEAPGQGEIPAAGLPILLMLGTAQGFTGR